MIHTVIIEFKDKRLKTQYQHFSNFSYYYKNSSWAYTGLTLY